MRTICAFGFIVIGVLVSACGVSASDDSVDSESTSSTSSTANPSTVATIGSVPPTEPDETPILLVLGDWGSGTEPQGAVAGAMFRFVGGRDVSAILTTGDNFYSNDAEFLMHPFAWATTGKIDFWITWGNHDIETDVRIDVINSAFDSQPRWAVHEWGKVDVIVLDSNQIDSQEQLEFLEGVLQESQRPAIVAFHHPALSCSNNGDTPGVLTSWVPIFDDDVLLVLNGHDHNYQRFESDNITYLVSGGGGRYLHDLEACSEDHSPMLAGQKLFHFLALSQNDHELTIEAIDVNGDVIDEVVIVLP